MVPVFSAGLCVTNAPKNPCEWKLFGFGMYSILVLNWILKNM